ncbi:stalk domain-containing protein [Fusibacter sp. 3D3]|uniref:stalk domain-containing protein n=1 Tax=Fusibacter sp. 3D3 TaxID=1048380 RepID=UPI0008531C3F|nr:stalk domain-containing protein [Fusibacter sp. 3D3]GAU76418.1 hypothetical protein F3D3_1015 [Fusibacter sp. 3D3]
MNRILERLYELGNSLKRQGKKVSTQKDVAPVSKNGRTFVPVKFAAENLNCTVNGINSTKEVVVIFEE